MRWPTRAIDIVGHGGLRRSTRQRFARRLRAEHRTRSKKSERLKREGPHWSNQVAPEGPRPDRGETADALIQRRPDPQAAAMTTQPRSPGLHKSPPCCNSAPRPDQSHGRSARRQASIAKHLELGASTISSPASFFPSVTNGKTTTGPRSAPTTANAQTLESGAHLRRIHRPDCVELAAQIPSNSVPKFTQITQ